VSHFDTIATPSLYPNYEENGADSENKQPLLVGACGELGFYVIRPQSATTQSPGPITTGTLPPNDSAGVWLQFYVVEVFPS
jgi:hypothetical protein